MGQVASRLAGRGLLSLLVGCDHATKGVAKAHLEGARPVRVIQGILDFDYVENTDIAFNLLRGIPPGIRAPALLISGAVACLGILGLLLLRSPRESRMSRFALVLVGAGAIGNYVDRVMRGYVVDFVHVRHWPVFNVADVYIVIGFALLAWRHFSRREGIVTSLPPLG